MTEFELSNAQCNVLELLVRLVGMSGVHKRPEQGDCIVLDLLPAEHTALLPGMGEPFCVRVHPDGRIEMISDAEAGLGERPDSMEAIRLRMEEMRKDTRSFFDPSWIEERMDEVDPPA